MLKNFVDAEHTTYFCKIIKLPPLEKKHQMIGVSWKTSIEYCVGNGYA